MQRLHVSPVTDVMALSRNVRETGPPVCQGHQTSMNGSGGNRSYSIIITEVSHGIKLTKETHDLWEVTKQGNGPHPKPVDQKIHPQESQEVHQVFERPFEARQDLDPLESAPFLKAKSPEVTDSVCRNVQEMCVTKFFGNCIVQHSD